RRAPNPGEPIHDRARASTKKPRDDCALGSELDDGAPLAGCTGTIGGAGGPGSGSGAGSTSGAGTGSGTGMPPGGSFVPQASSLRRLTIPQYVNALHDLLGASIQVTTEFDDDIRFG